MVYTKRKIELDILVRRNEIKVTITICIKLTNTLLTKSNTLQESNATVTV